MTKNERRFPMASNTDYTIDNQALQHKGQVWDRYRAIMAQYGNLDEITAEDRSELDRLEGQFKAIREQQDRRKAAAEMADYFGGSGSTPDESKRLATPTPDRGLAARTGLQEYQPTPVSSKDGGGYETADAFDSLDYQNTPNPETDRMKAANRHLRLKQARTAKQIVDQVEYLKAFDALLRGGALIAMRSSMPMPAQWIPYLNGTKAVMG